MSLHAHVEAGPLARKGRYAASGASLTKVGAGAEIWSVAFLDETVVAEVDAWPLRLRASLDRIVARIETRGLMSLTEEHAKHIRGKLWELRARAEGDIGRAFYVTVTGKRVVIVLCAVKKTQATPQRWITLAERRAQQIDKGETL